MLFCCSSLTGAPQYAPNQLRGQEKRRVRHASDNRLKLAHPQLSAALEDQMKLHNLTHLNISACNIDCHTMIPLCDLLASRWGSPLLSLDLSRNHIGRSGMLLLASMFDDPVLMQLQQLDLRFNNHDGLLPLASAV